VQPKIQQCKRVNSRRLPGAYTLRSSALVQVRRPADLNLAYLVDLALRRMSAFDPFTTLRFMSLSSPDGESWLLASGQPNAQCHISRPGMKLRRPATTSAPM
jgi:hypothetical protein